MENNNNNNLQEQEDIQCKIEQMQNLINFWTKNMRLNDWDITIDILDNGDFVIRSAYPEAEGENTIDEPRKASEIIIKAESALDHEYTIVHELSHLITNTYASMWYEWEIFFPPITGPVIEQSFYNRNEAVVNHITKALLNVRDAAYQQGYEKAIEELNISNISKVKEQ